MATSRERLQTTLEHRQPDRVCVGIGSTVSAISASALWALHRRLIGGEGYRVRIRNPYWMCGDVDDELLHAIHADVASIRGTGYSFPNPDCGWVPRDLFDGTPALFPDDHAITIDENGDWLIHPCNDPTALPSHRMPRGSLDFNPIYRQDPIDEDNLRPEDNAEEFVPLTDEILGWVEREAKRLQTQTDFGILIELPAMSLGGTGGINGRTLRRPRGIRSFDEWYLSLAIRKDYVRAVFEIQTQVGVANIERLAPVVGTIAQMALVSGTDFGAQRGTVISPAAYKELYSPCFRRMNDTIHRLTSWKSVIHSCGDVRALLPLFIEDGFDVFNPVQATADHMDPAELKKEFGQDLVFFGGGVDTQGTLPFGTPRQVYDQVRERIDILNDGGGYVFSPTQSIDAGTPVENIEAMLRALEASYRA